MERKESDKFDWDLFFKICREHNIPLSSEYKAPVIEDNGALRELKPDDIINII